MKYKTLLTLLLIGLLLVIALSQPTKTRAQSSSNPITRDEIIRRAQSWVDAGVEYNQSAYREGYRTDCSGFVSYALGLAKADGSPDPRTTVTLDYVSSPISRDELLPGDIINDNDPGNNGHVVIFSHWLDDAHTQYQGCELSSRYDTICRSIAYPYDWNAGDYIPRRYNNVEERPVDILLPSTGHFSDMDINNVFYGYIEALYSIHAINGFSDGTYRPNDYATRGAAAKIIILSIGEAREYNDGQTVCNVSQTHTFYSFIRRMLELSISTCPGNGDWKPDDPLVRGGLAKLVVLARDRQEPSYGSCQSPYSDVLCTHTFYKYIRRLKEICTQKGILCGYSDGTFHPDESITRGGIAKLVVIGLDLEDHIPRFYDVLFDNPFYPYVEGIAERGITSGCSSNPPLFCPDDLLTRGGAAKFIIRAMGENPYYNDGILPFPDVPTNHTFYHFIRRLKELEITTGYNDGTYKPDLNITRGAIAKFIVRALAVRGITCQYNQPQAFSDVPPNHTFYSDIHFSFR